MNQDDFIATLERHSRVDDPIWRAGVVAKITLDDIARHRDNVAEIERASLSQLRDPEWRRKHGLRPSTPSSTPDSRSTDPRFRAGFAAYKAGKPLTRRQMDDPQFRGGYVAALTGSQTTKHAAREAHVREIDAGDEHGAQMRFMPRDNLIRGMMRFPMGRAGRVTQRRSATGDSSVMEGHFAVFSQWTEIDSMWEGNFMEQIAPGAFSKTFRESRAAIKVLFQHGRDPQIGDKPLGTIDELDEDEIGAHYAVPLFDTTYNADLIPGLRAGAYGASFRFSVVKESVDNAPAKSTWNPAGIPQRTITEARVFEFGPVTFPAYTNATAGMRSLTDYFDRAA